MFSKKLFRFLFFVSISLFSFASLQGLAQELDVPSKEGSVKNKRQKKADKKKDKKKQASESLIEKGTRRHQEIQTKEVQKRMKKNLKKAQRINHKKRRPFYQRWFRKER